MEKDIRHVYSEFNEGATRHFYSIFHEFSIAAETVHRHGNENVFQLLRAKYISDLKHKLEKSAGLLMNQSEKAETLGRLRINFTETINYFLKEFVRKSESL